MIRCKTMGENLAKIVCQGAAQPIRDTCVYFCDDMTCTSSCQNVCPCTCSVTTHAHRDLENIEEEGKEDEHSEPL